MSRALYRMLSEARQERDRAFELLRDVLAAEDRISAAIGTPAEPEYVAKIRALVAPKVPA
jgi:hypothetical protein